MADEGSSKSRPRKSTGKHRKHLLDLDGETKGVIRAKTTRVARAKALEADPVAQVPLTEDEEAFVRALFTPGEDGKPRTRAAAFALIYPSEGDGRGYGRVLNRPHVQRRIAEVKRQIRAEVLSDERLAFGIADQAARLVAKNERWFGLRDIQVERAKFYSKMKREGLKFEKDALEQLSQLRASLGSAMTDGGPITLVDLWRKLSEVESMIHGMDDEDSPFPIPNLDDLKAGARAVYDLMARMKALEDLIDERLLSTPPPGAETGLIVHSDKMTKFGIQREWAVDMGPIQEMRALEGDVASELGQVAPKRTDITSNGETITPLVLMGLATITDDEVDARIRAIESKYRNVIPAQGVTVEKVEV